MKARFSSLATLACSVVIALSASGCATVGGRSVSDDQLIKSVLVKYRSVDPTLSPLAEYALVETDKGLGILEKLSASTKAFVIDRAWRDDRGDHFVAWGEAFGYRSSAWEVVVPADRQREAAGYIYQQGTFSVVRMNGSPRPVPHKFNPIPDFRLIPTLTAPRL